MFYWTHGTVCAWRLHHIHPGSGVDALTFSSQPLYRGPASAHCPGASALVMPCFSLPGRPPQPPCYSSGGRQAGRWDCFTQDQRHKQVFVLEIKPKALCMLAKCSTTELSPVQCRKVLLEFGFLK